MFDTVSPNFNFNTLRIFQNQFNMIDESREIENNKSDIK